jgi:hypothetical protein
MGDHLLTNFTDDRQSTLSLGVMRFVFWSTAAMAAMLTALFLLHH